MEVGKDLAKSELPTSIQPSQSDHLVLLQPREVEKGEESKVHAEEFLPKQAPQ